MRTTFRHSASIAAASLLAALIGGCAGHANEQQPVATTTTTTTTGNGAVASTSTAPVDDAALTSNVQATLANTPGVNANEINVQSSEGVVTLSGDVDSASAASAAVQATQGVSGVSSVHNDLTVVNPPQS
ncbi:MAG TPA: BON domain-containing protein [Gammaproteobacteria bacterium]|jgi:hyperosmotically inducible protein